MCIESVIENKETSVTERKKRMTLVFVLLCVIKPVSENKAAVKNDIIVFLF